MNIVALKNANNAQSAANSVLSDIAYEQNRLSILGAASCGISKRII